MRYVSESFECASPLTTAALADALDCMQPNGAIRTCTCLVGVAAWQALLLGQLLRAAGLPKQQLGTAGAIANALAPVAALVTPVHHCRKDTHGQCTQELNRLLTRLVLTTSQIDTGWEVHREYGSWC